MGIQESLGQSEQSSLQSAPKSKKDELQLEIMEAAEALFLLFGKSSPAPSDQHDAQRNSTALSKTKSKDLPEKETDKEVVVRSVNPSLGNRDGEEPVTSVANTLKVHGDVGTENQGEGSKELSGPSFLLATAIAPDSEIPTTIHPSSAPESSLLHVLYLQVLSAGRDGITVRELFKYLKHPAEVLGFECDWKAQVRRHLKTNPHFCEAKGYHYLVCNHQLEVQQSSDKSSIANIGSTVHEGDTPAVLRPLSEQATESEEMLQSMGDMQIMPSSVADPTQSQLVSHGPLLTVNRKRKSSFSHDEELPASALWN